MPTTNKFKEDSNIDGDLLPSDSKDREIVNTSTRDKKRPETSSWWINELDSLGIKKSSSSSEGNNNRNESLSSQQLEDLTDDVKQKFIRDYKVCYNE
jgi:hypothetical protein